MIFLLSFETVDNEHSNLTALILKPFLFFYLVNTLVSSGI